MKKITRESFETVWTDYEDLSRMNYADFIDPVHARAESARFFSYNLDQAFDSCRIDQPIEFEDDLH